MVLQPSGDCNPLLRWQNRCSGHEIELQRLPYCQREPKSVTLKVSMRSVVVAGIGKTAFGALADRDLRSLAVEAGQKCLENAHAGTSQVEAFYLGNFAGPSFVGQIHLAPYVAGAMGITGVPATRF